MGLASFPLCFDLYTTLWFNNIAVTTDVAAPDVSRAAAATTATATTQETELSSAQPSPAQPSRHS
jgi:hypothetical protein